MKQTTTQRVAAEVRAEMARQRLSQSQLATHLGLSRSAAGRRFLGDLPYDADQLVAVAAWLGVPASRLLGEEAVA